MARKKRDFDYMDLYNPNYRNIKANMFDGISGSSVLNLQGQNGINTDWNFGQQQNNITAPNTMYSNFTTVNGGTHVDNYTDPLQSEYHRVNPIKYLTMSEPERMRQNQLRQEARQEKIEAKQEAKQNDKQQEGNGFGMWGNVINGAANAMITAFQDDNANTATKVATALGVPELGKIWSADLEKGNNQLDYVKSKINDASNRLIQDSNDTQGAFSAIKNNNQLNLINANPSKQLSWRDFRGNLFKKGAVATLQGASAGSIGGPWGALGGATVGTLGALFGGIGAKKRAKRAFDEYKDKINYLQNYANNFNALQRLNRQQSNENLLNNGLKQQRIQDLANINAYGGNINNYNNIAAMGGQFDFNLSPNMVDLQNQSLVNQKYKYMNQIQPTGFNKSNYNMEYACGGKLNKFDFGGSMNGVDIPTGMQSYENGGSHEENPNGGIQVGVDNQGTPNLVEEGEFRWNDYVFSNRIDVDLDILSDFNVPTKKQGKKSDKGKLSYADFAKKMAKKAGNLNDPITKDTINENMKRVSQAQDFQKAQMNSDNQLADYKNALKNQTQGNPMYGSMKYSGLGNVNHGLNDGSSSLESVDNSTLSNVNRSGNEMMAAYGGKLFWDGGDIENMSPRELYAIFGTTDLNIIQNMINQSKTTPEITDKPMVDANGNIISVNPETGELFANGIPTGQSLDPSTLDVNQQGNNNYKWTNINGVTSINPLYNLDVNLGFGQTQNGVLGNDNIYNQQFGLGIRPDYVANNNPNYTTEAVSTYGKNVNGQVQYDPNGNPVMLYPNTFKGMNGKEQTINSTFGSPMNSTFTLQPVNVDNMGFYNLGNNNSINNTNNSSNNNQSPNNISSPTNESSYSKISYSGKITGNNSNTNENIPEFPPAESTQEGLPNTKNQAGIVDNRNLEEKYAQYATAYRPNIPTLNTNGLYAQLGKGFAKNLYNWAGLANTDYKPNYKPEQDLRALGKTGYVPRTADHSGMYRAADLYDINLANNSAQAQAQATSRAMGNVNDRNQAMAGRLAADYNATLGIGNNYQTMFNTNSASRRDAYNDNKQTEQTNVAVNNDMYRDNQNAGIQAKNFELNALTSANQMQWAKDQYADTQNRISALNKQSDTARMVDNQINFLVDKAKENAYYNIKNKDPRQMYWNDPSTGDWYFNGDNGYYNNLRKAMYGKINSLDTISNEELFAMADKKGWNNITKEDMQDVIDRQTEREKKISDDKKSKDAQDLRNAQIKYKQMLANIRAVNPDYNPGFKDTDFTTADDWLTGYNGLNTYWLSAINPYLSNRNVNNENAYGGKLKTNKHNKKHSYDYMAI